MIREAFEWIADRVQEASKPIEVRRREDEIVYLLASGEEKRVFLSAPRRCHTVRTIEDFGAACERWAESEALGGVVFHNDAKVVLVCDDTDRHDVVVMPLEETDVFRIFRNLAQPSFPAMGQREFLRMLRRDLRRTIPPSLINAIAKIEVVSNGQSRTEINPGRERGTREFAADLASEAIPETVECRVPLYRFPGMDQPWPIVCSLEYTLPPHQVEFRFSPLADEIDNVLRAAQMQLHGLLVDALQGRSGCEDLDVLYGTL